MKVLNLLQKVRKLGQKSLRTAYFSNNVHMLGTRSTRGMHVLTGRAQCTGPCSSPWESKLQGGLARGAALGPASLVWLLPPTLTANQQGQKEKEKKAAKPL